MIKFKLGDLLKALEDGEIDALGHGCNCGHIMGGGIAKFISRKWPEVYKVDVEQTDAWDEDKLGTFSRADLECGSVYNLYTQFDTENRRTYYSAVSRAFTAMIVDIHRYCKQQSRDTYRVGVPLIGAVLGGGDWNQIYACIYDVYTEFMKVNTDVDIQLTIYLLPHDENAIATAMPYMSPVIINGEVCAAIPMYMPSSPKSIADASKLSKYTPTLEL